MFRKRSAPLRRWPFWAACAALCAIFAARSAAPDSKARAAAKSARGASAAAVPDTTLGLSPVSVFGAPTPPKVTPEASAPAEKPVVPRAYPGAPPRIPHGIADFVPITAAANACLECHAPAAAADTGSKPIPPSHYTDLRNDPQHVRESLAGARYVCTSCHAPLTDAKPLVANRFE